MPFGTRIFDRRSSLGVNEGVSANVLEGSKDESGVFGAAGCGREEVQVP